MPVDVSLCDYCLKSVYACGCQKTAAPYTTGTTGVRRDE